MHYSDEEKKMWLEDWRQSGRGAWQYAKENGLIPQTFVGWTKKEAKEAGGFVEIKAKASPAVPPSSEILVEKGNIKIHIPLLPGHGELRAVMEGLGVVL